MQINNKMSFVDYINQRKPTKFVDPHTGEFYVDRRSAFVRVIKLKAPKNFKVDTQADFIDWLRNQRAKPETLHIGRALWKEYEKNVKRAYNARRSTSNRNS